MLRRWKGPTPGFNAQSAQLTQARRGEPWLARGSHTVQQQALRDLDQGCRNFFAGTHRRPRWRKAGEDEGLRIVGPQGLRVRQDNRARSSVLVPKIGKEAERLLRLQRRLVRARRGSNRRWKVKTLLSQVRAGWCLFVTRLEQKAPGRVEKVKAAYTSQTCHACKHIAAQSRKSQANFVCVARGHQANADVNAARNIAAGQAVAARGDHRVLARSVKREPQHARPPKVA